MDKEDQVIELLKEIRDNQKIQIEAHSKIKSLNIKLYLLVLLLSVVIYYSFYLAAR